MFGAAWTVSLKPGLAQDLIPGCDTPGWFPAGFGLKDHSIFKDAGYYYLIANQVPGENRFAYARTRDFCSWEDLGPVLGKRVTGTWEEQSVWAPYVLEKEGIFYLFYTGVTRNFTQSIMLVVMTDPANPASWRSEGMVFQPNHPEILWEPYAWADARDPFVLFDNERYLLYYSAMGRSGPVVGLATASDPAGPWEDLGPVAYEVLTAGMMESPAITLHEGWYYLFYNYSGFGERYQVSRSPLGPWQPGGQFVPGWAHEVWDSYEGDLLTSYLTDYSVTIAPINWGSYSSIPRPFIGTGHATLRFPVVMK